MFFNLFNSCCNQPPTPRPCAPTRACVGIPGPVGPRGPMGAQGARGETGATGATGPQGPAGLNALRDGLYAYGTNQTVTAGALVPLSTTATTPTTTMTLSDNSVSLPAGSYLVSYGAVGNSSAEETGILSIQLYANDTALTNEIISAGSNATTPATLAKTILYVNSTDGTTLSLHNSSTTSATYTSAYLTILRIT